ncbi:hypothetical protein [Streptomyces sp. NPDC047061]|uniref:hypothetical protein n=1 Tax=Streptomyces sp. NPDC047061 TaxID=3154605 RepID=UPI0033C178CF
MSWVKDRTGRVDQVLLVQERENFLVEPTPAYCATPLRSRRALVMAVVGLVAAAERRCLPQGTGVVGASLRGR